MKALFRIAWTLVIVMSCSAYGQEYKWYKGNTHTHTTNSDGNETPRRVVRWYFDHNYNFLVLTDHNTLTDIRYLDTDKNDDFILIPGEEVTDSYQNKPLHVNGIGIRKVVKPQHGNGIVETLQKDIDAIREAGGIAHVNHPNWRYSFADKELAELKDVKLFEVYNIGKDSNNYSAGDSPGMEEIWDRMLSRKVLLYGVVSDDTHDYVGEFSADKANPGRGWVMVRAADLTPEAIIASLERGDFYGSTGVTLSDVAVTDKEYRVEIEPNGDAKYTTMFIGKGGEVLKRDVGLKSSYQFRGDEGYVRAKVISSTGDFAITQPVLVK
jgi:predicted metal-dependent phosphoesterase TrpH